MNRRVPPPSPPSRCPHGFKRRPERGFTLTELAIVLIIVGLLLASILPPLSAQHDQRNFSETEAILAELREAVIGFALANGRLPRPAVSAADGSEKPTCLSDADCQGFIPWQALGVRKADSWNKLIRYSVTPAFATAPFDLKTAGTKTIQTRDSTGTAVTMASGVPAVIFSQGKQNFGTTLDGVTLSGPSSGDEFNNDSGDAITYMSRLPAVGGANGDFDDVVTWVPRTVLLNRMVQAGKLP